MRRYGLLPVALLAYVLLAGCATANLGAPKGESDAAVEAYRIYAARCSSAFAWPLTASVTCERTQPAPDLAAQAKMIADAVVKGVTAALAAARTPDPEPSAADLLK